MRAAADLNFLGKEFGHLLLRGELDKQGFHSITPHWTQVSKEPPLWANEYFEMIPGQHPNANHLRRMPCLDNYGVREYKAKASKIEELYTKIVQDSIQELVNDATSCKSLVSRYGPVFTDVPYDQSHS